MRSYSRPQSQFQSAPPAKGAIKKLIQHRYRPMFQSAPPAKGAMDYCPRLAPASTVSIRAPREGGDSSASGR